MSVKNQQLGMNVSTANHKLKVDLLFKFVVLAGHKCHRCGKELTRDTFSVDHIQPWLHTDKPLELFFDLDNIAFSHQACNTGARRCNGPRLYDPPTAAARVKESKRRHWTPEKRREHYLKTGK